MVLKFVDKAVATCKPKTCRKGKIVHVIRHGQAQHNVDPKCLMHHDTQLTAHGWCQARALRKVLPKLRPQVVITSAVLRALQTTRAMGFKGVTTIVPDVREVATCPANMPIDASRAISGDLNNEFGAYDWSLASQLTKEAGGTRQYQRRVRASDGSTRAIRDRAKKLTKYLEKRPESSIVVVSHGEFLEHLTGDCYMDNCEVRAYRVIQGKWRRLRAWKTGL
jgi:broad specificity phosphatase PhoE